MSIKISFGLDNEVRVDEDKYDTAGDITRDESLKAFLGFGDNVELVVNSIPVGSDYILSDQDEVSIRTRANKKGC